MNEKLEALEKQFYELSLELIKVRSEVEPQMVDDYTFVTPEGKKSLSELFGDRDELLVVHNMGRSCVYCTLWADGFVSFYPHLLDRAAFAVSSPDTPEVQAEFAESRGWPFTMVSDQAGDFTKDMGFTHEEHVMPGISAFIRKDGKIYRTGKSFFGPGDPFCAPWHLFSMLPGAMDDWSPKYSY